MEFDERKYEEKLKELFVKFPSVQKVGFADGAYKPGLEGMMKFDEILGHPWRNFRSIHVAGTNGKGSVASMLASALAESGLRVGLYTSPHLVDFRERMRIIGEGMIRREEVWDFLEGYEKEMDGLSFFEITTGMAFRWFSDMKVDAAVIEVGLGGRLDSTNIITPDVSVVTSIGLDHCQMLGNTRGEIAAEKAGIFKPGVPAVIWGRDDETIRVFERKAGETGCQLIVAEDRDRTAEEDDILALMDLKGPYQKQNLHTVTAVLELLGIKLGQVKDGIIHTASRACLRGRWETLCDRPLTICDIGHNPAALRINFRRLQETGRPLVLVYGVMADKDYRTNIQLIPSGATVIATAPDTPRALKMPMLLEELEKGRDDIRAIGSESVADAVGIARRLATEMPDSLIYIGGSTFVVSEAVTLFDKK